METCYLKKKLSLLIWTAAIDVLLCIYKWQRKSCENCIHYEDTYGICKLTNHKADIENPLLTSILNNFPMFVWKEIVI